MSSLHYVPHADSIRNMDTDQLRNAFLLSGLFQTDRVTLRMLDLDRVVVGGVVPASTTQSLEAPAEFDAQFFAQRREIGILNIGGKGKVHVDQQTYTLENCDALYVGRGSRNITFESNDAVQHARFYLISYPAHAELPSALVARTQAETVELGSIEAANRRTIRKYFHPDSVSTAQLVMGITELSTGSVWNTMPPHTHQRRSEVYLYFDLAPDAAVFHLLGRPDQTRNLIVRDGEVVLSPGWSIHAGCGTSRYSFCWAMGGENQSFTDMQPVPLASLR
jgi:4-deoxy-L-threo-5-hexosulose-uronate ketol-isomerase